MSVHLFGKTAKIAASLATLSLLSISLAGCGTSTATTTAAAPPFYAEDTGGWPATWTYNGFSTTFGLSGEELYVDLPLAFQETPSAQYAPELASSWQFVGNTLQVQIRAGAKWQNGDPVTSTDVVDSYLLGATVGWPWLSVASNVTASGPSTVIFQLRRDVAGTTNPVTHQDALYNILQSYVWPASVYGHLVTPAVKAAVVADATATSTAAQSKAAATLAKVGKSVLAFNPPTVIGDGPFKFVAMTTDKVKVEKWPGYFGASQIHVPEIIFENDADTPVALTAMFSSEYDYGGPSTTSGVIKRFLKGKDTHYTVLPTLGGEAFEFNCKTYPLNIPQVRQALAYAINRKSVTIADDGFLKNTPETVLTGMPSSLQNTYLGSNATLLREGFKAYAYNPQKARQMLLAQHFTFKNGSWYTPQGKPFTIAITSPAGWTSTQLASSNLASQLSSFGIKATSTAVEQPGYWSYLTQGQFDVAWNFSGGFNVFPIESLAYLLLSYNIVPNSSPPQSGMGFGPTVNIPGIGTKNLGSALEAAESVANPTQIRQLTMDYAKLINQQVPYIQYDTKNAETFWSTAHYVDWPSLSNTTMWGPLNESAVMGLAWMMMHGYIRPR